MQKLDSKKVLVKSAAMKPRYSPPLDEDFYPAVLYNRAFQERVIASGGGVPLVLGIERANAAVSRYETRVLEHNHSETSDNYFFVERLVKFLLWQYGGWKVYVGGPSEIGEYIRACYGDQGDRAFDARFMGDEVYQKPFTVESCNPEDVPATSDQQRSIGRHLSGYRIGFDLGASDLKVSAVVDGEAVFATEIEWDPVHQTSPLYHREKISAALKLAASKMPRVDAIGGSSAGIYIDNRPMIASLYRGIPKADFEQISNMFLEIGEDYGVPLEIVNDGEVTALAGSMSLSDTGVLGIAMGSSEAAGYVTLDGGITNWLNELAFAPVDYNPSAFIDEWSGDRGNGALYFSQQCVFRLAPKAGLAIPDSMTKAQKLTYVQERLEAGHGNALKIWQSIGIYLGYTLAHYAEFYDMNHVLILGRCTSGSGGRVILDGANTVLNGEFPELAAQVSIHLPDEKSRRVGQSIAAASLPRVDR
ncbi:MAG: hypothetical protein WA996_02085 [Candidatus Promineifilaceae bacterium]